MPTFNQQPVTVITGDVTIDWNLACHHPEGESARAPWSPENRGVLSWQPGGAAMLGNLVQTLADFKEAKTRCDFLIMKEKVKSPNIDDKLSPQEESYHHSFALWRPDAPDKRFRPSPVWDHEKANVTYPDERWVWRVNRYLGCNLKRRHSPEGLNLDTHGLNRNEFSADVIVIDDLGFGFRDNENSWRLLFHDTSKETENQIPWVILQTSGIRDRKTGRLLEYLLNKCPERLLVVLAIEDLRSAAEVRIPESLSWEHTMDDLARELPQLKIEKQPLLCRHLVVSLGTVGAALLTRDQDLAPLSLQLFHAPRFMENEWELPLWGRMLGRTVTLTASLALQVMMNLGECDLRQALGEGIKAGIAAVRELYLSGYQCHCPKCRAQATVSDGRYHLPSGYHYQKDWQDHPPELIFPTGYVAGCLITRLLSPGVSKENWKTSIIASDELEEVEFNSETLSEIANGTPQAPPWTILARRVKEKNQGDWLKKAEGIAVEGLSRQKIPMGRFGELISVDRIELEVLRSIQSLIRSYSVGPQKTPLNLAVFGPPGSGKSFAVEEVVRSVFRSPEMKQKLDCSCRETESETIEFDLSQFKETAALTGALHQVHDIWLKGKLPLVFWDEFDTKVGDQELAWLRFFLAPMEKGVFAEGQITHPLGPCIFVFAGGTSCSREKFEAKYVNEASNPLKVRDFLSRLHGSLNVLGINKEPSDKPVSTDAAQTYLVRRAVLLRSLLHKRARSLFAEPKDMPYVEGRTSRGKLRIDAGVLRAFLETKEYKYESRSMRVIVDESTVEHKKRFDRSSLPPTTLLSLHLDSADFEGRLFQVKPVQPTVVSPVIN